MKFIARFGFGRPTHGRLYLSDQGLEKFFGRGRPVDEARKYASGVILSLEASVFLRAKYLVGVIYGDAGAGKRAIDLLGYTKFKNWPGNPEVSAWYFKGTDPVGASSVICGEGRILFEQVEEPYRRITKSLNEYVNNPPPFIPSNLGRLQTTLELF